MGWRLVLPFQETLLSAFGGGCIYKELPPLGILSKKVLGKHQAHPLSDGNCESCRALPWAQLLCVSTLARAGTDKRPASSSLTSALPGVGQETEPDTCQTWVQIHLFHTGSQATTLSNTLNVYDTWFTHTHTTKD